MFQVTRSALDGLPVGVRRLLALGQRRRHGDGGFVALAAVPPGAQPSINRCHVSIAGPQILQTTRRMLDTVTTTSSRHEYYGFSMVSIKGSE